MRLYRLLRGIALAWVVAGGVFFLSGPLGIFIGAPRWLPLPWSDFDDFVQTSDGHVYVSLGFYHRVLHYDAGGWFVASYEVPSFKGQELARDARGRVFCRSVPNVLSVFDGSWRLLKEMRGSSGGCTWQLDANGEPVPDEALEKAPVVDRQAVPGDYIFCLRDRRSTFACSDGSRLVRVGSRLERRSADGSALVTFQSPWFLRPFTYPWPLSTAWPLFPLVYYVELKRKQFSREMPPAYVPRWVAVDALANTGVLIAIVGVWVGALVLLITLFNVLLPHGSPWNAMFVVPLAAWLFSGIAFTKRSLRRLKALLAERRKALLA